MREVAKLIQEGQYFYQLQRAKNKYKYYVKLCVEDGSAILVADPDKTPPLGQIRPIRKNGRNL